MNESTQYKTVTCTPASMTAEWQHRVRENEEQQKIIRHWSKFVPADKADEIFHTLRTQIEWDKMDPLPQYNDLRTSFPDIYKYMRTEIESRVREQQSFFPSLNAVIVTNLPDGSRWVWDHFHPCQTEMKVSFGGSRPIVVNNETFMTDHGSVVLFGPVHHEVPTCAHADEQINIVMYFGPKGHGFDNE